MICLINQLSVIFDNWPFYKRRGIVNVQFLKTHTMIDTTGFNWPSGFKVTLLLLSLHANLHTVHYAMFYEVRVPAQGLM